MPASEAPSPLADAAAWAAVAAACQALHDAGLDYWLTVDFPAGHAYQSWKPGGRHDWGKP